MTQFRVTIFAGPSETDDRLSSVVERTGTPGDLAELLRTIGLEYKTADYYTQRKVVITIDPFDSAADVADLKAKAREAAALLEEI